MKKQLVSFPIKSYITKYFYLFLIPLIVIPIILVYFSSLKTKVRSYEKLNLFISCPLKNDADKDKLLEKLFKDTTSTIVETNVYIYDESVSESQTSLYTYYASISDILIFNKSLISSDVSSFHKLPNEYISPTNYPAEYGYRVYDSDSSTGYLLEYFKYTNENYYMFINKNSEHISSLEKDSVTDDALILFRNIIQ